MHDRRLTFWSSRSFIVQIGGGLMSLSKTVKTAKRGLHIVEAGLIFQELLIIYFFFLTLRLISKLKLQMPKNATYRRVRLQMNVVQFSLFLISVRRITSYKCIVSALMCHCCSIESCIVWYNSQLPRVAQDPTTSRVMNGWCTSSMRARCFSRSR